MKRIGLLILTNILVVVTLSIVLNLLGVRPYLTANGIDYNSLMIFCLVWGMGGAFISLLMSKMMAKMMMGVQIVDASGPYSDLVQKVHLLARRAGIEKMPDVGIYSSPEVNAFATGPSKNNSLVAVSSGLLSQMNDQEVEGVLAHEIAHVANGDMVTMTLVQGVMNAFVMFFARVVAHLIDNFFKDEDGRGGLGYFGYVMVTFVLEILFGILSAPIVMGFSRYREYRADAGGAQLAGKDKMIAALESLQRNVEKIQKADGAFQSMKISNKSGFAKWFSSHPPLAARIDALRRSAY